MPHCGMFFLSRTLKGNPWMAQVLTRMFYFFLPALIVEMISIRKKRNTTSMK